MCLHSLFYMERGRLLKELHGRDNTEHKLKLLDFV